MYAINLFDNTPTGIDKAIRAWKSDKRRAIMITAMRYYNGRNETIEEVKKQVVVNSKDGYHTRENIFVSNTKIADSFVAEMVDQKVNTLLSEPPQFEGVSDVVVSAMENTADYQLQQLATNAAACGVAYAYISEKNGVTLTNFDSENCVAFVDVEGELQALIRFWTSAVDFDGTTVEHAETYTTEGVTSYVKADDDDYTLIGFMGHRQYDVGNAIETTRINAGWNSGLPILMLKNNEACTPDMTPSIRAQTDAIDIVLSDFANNLADFQDVYWVLKGLDSVSASEMGQFMEALKNTKKASLPEGADATPTQVDIPFAAREAFVERISKRRTANAGVLDMELVTSGGLTATAIMAASGGLRRRVIKFKPRVHAVVFRLLQFASETAGEQLPIDVDIRFSEYYLGNDAETINNLTLSLGQISQRTYLERHPYVTSVDEELERLAEEAGTKFTTEPEPEVVEVVESEPEPEV